MGLGSSRFVSDRLETALAQQLGPALTSEMGAARLDWNALHQIALQVDDVHVRETVSKTTLLQAERLDAGLRLLPLLIGRVEFDSASLSRGRLSAAGGGSGGFASIRDDRGLVDPDRLLEAFFSGLDQVVAATRSVSIGQVTFKDVALEGIDAAGSKSIVLRDLRIGNEPGGVALAGDIVIGESGFRMDGIVEPQQAGVDANSFRLTVDSLESAGDISNLALTLSGSRSGTNEPRELRVEFKANDQELDFSKEGPLRGDVDLSANLTRGAGKLEIERLDIDVGRSRYEFTGAIGPVPRSGAQDAEDDYRFELVSNKSVIAPEDSPEASMPAAMRLAGSLSSQAERLEVNEITVRTSSGEVAGKAAFTFATDKSPGVMVDVGLQDMSVEQVKQLWPWIAAGGARRWVMANFFGGIVKEGTVRYDVAPGRLDIKGPLSSSELSGRFIVEQSRFETAGALPPIRGASGKIAFSGNAVDITLSAGSAYMASNRQVAASNGKFSIADVSAEPLIAKLDIDVAGQAAAIAEYVSYEPIDALDELGVVPEDFTGNVKGHVRADIPLERSVDSKTLDWLVSLSYNDLSVKKPIDGQLLSAADGTIEVDPGKAVVQAAGRLNGFPARVDVVRPLGGSDVEARQNVKMVFDDKTRATVAPGLNAFVSGPIEVMIDGRMNNASGTAVVADLTKAKLELPWVGWSKGAGIPATARFSIVSKGDVQTVQDLRLEGQSFSARGDVELANGALRSARFGNVRLNSEDSVAVSAARKGKGYAISLAGERLDARSLIKGLKSESEAREGAKGTPVTLDANLDRVAGFGGEDLRGVRLRYSGGAGGIGALTLQGKTSSGANVMIENAIAGGERRVTANSGDAGALLRFLSIYDRVDGGELQLSLAGEKTLRGRLDLRAFTVVDEPRFGSLVSTKPTGGDRNLSQAVNANIDTSRVRFDRGFAELEKAPSSLRISNGALRGPVIGTTFQGTAYDAANQIDMTGTFMPAYGLNSIFGEIPILGAFLGNGRDRGLIGITYRLTGEAKSPRLQVNPLSVIAPGIFRSIFEF